LNLKTNMDTHQTEKRWYIVLHLNWDAGATKPIAARCHVRYIFVAIYRLGC